MDKRQLIEVGERAILALKNAEREIKKAYNWGVFDMLGGGFLPTLIKRGKMSKAKGYADEAQHYIRLFTDNIQYFGYVNLDLHYLLDIFDFIFDSFFVDVLVQSKISKAKKELRETIEIMEDLVSKMRHQIPS